MEYIEIIIVFKKFIVWLKCIKSHKYIYVSTERSHGLVHTKFVCSRCLKEKIPFHLEFE